ncbi:MAPEG family protein [Bordetella genomosp. 11]|uniref:MAPEG family protein n=1 Tax=Bordetella genomosp. 11 TaxID=1416808 RepID=A0A261UZE4_9BORD|nr:MAPEG family protein [Bordetella genomosp. 11]OZI67268.1 hypothetical protein CAL28_06190 [Bordetella genomosp. 11]
MDAYYSVALVTLLSGLLCFGMALASARAHMKTGIAPPAMTGAPLLDRTVRTHANTLEWMMIFLPALWLFAIYWSPFWATILGLVWIVGRLIYFAGYVAAAEKRFPGFAIQALATTVLVLGALGRIIYLMTQQ